MMGHLVLHNIFGIVDGNIMIDLGHLGRCPVDGIQSRIVQQFGSFAHGVEDLTPPVVLLSRYNLEVFQSEVINVAIEMIHFFTVTTRAHPYLDHQDMDGVRASSEGDVRIPATVRYAVARLLAVATLAGVVDAYATQTIPRERVGALVLGQEDVEAFLLFDLRTIMKNENQRIGGVDFVRQRSRPMVIRDFRLVIFFLFSHLCEKFCAGF